MRENSLGQEEHLLITPKNYLMPPRITRPLLPVYEFSPGVQAHFLVEYDSYSIPCTCSWHVQRSDRDPMSIVQKGSVVSTDCSSILILESMAKDLQGIYTFFVENRQGRATTHTKLIVMDSYDDSKLLKSRENVFDLIDYPIYRTFRMSKTC